MRTQLIRYLCDNAESQNLFLIVADLGYSVVEPFLSKHPERFINVGVAEQSMASIASGIASEGVRCFCYSIANFPTFRCAEQIRNDIDYHLFPVCIVSVGGGLAYGSMGYSHHAIQDYGLMRSFPNMTIYSPCDANQTQSCLQHIASTKTPAYLRLHKAGEAAIGEEIKNIIPGEPVFLCGNVDASACILTTGYPAQELFKRYKASNNVAVITMPAWGEAYRSNIVSELLKYDVIYTVEDHLLAGGFGSWLLESVASSEVVERIRLKCLPSSIIDEIGTEDYLLNMSGIFDGLPDP